MSVDIIADGRTKVTFVDAADDIADVAAPTAAEANAGTDLQEFITPDGLAVELSDDSVDTSALNSTFSAMKVGRSSVTLEITFKDQGKTNAPWTTVADRAPGFLVIRRNVASEGAFAASDEVEVYTVVCGDHKIIPAAENEVSKFAIDLYSTADPVLDATVA